MSKPDVHRTGHQAVGLQANSMTKKEKKFLNLPHLDGGRELLKKFIRENLQYPEEALEKGTEGDVIVKYKVSGKGEVLEPDVVKGIGHGCDEEAIRLVKMLSHRAVKNRGVRVITDNKMKIPFRIKNQKSQQKVSISYSTEKKDTGKPLPGATQKAGVTKEGSKKEVYTYTISI